MAARCETRRAPRRTGTCRPCSGIRLPTRCLLLILCLLLPQTPCLVWADESARQQKSEPLPEALAALLKEATPLNPHGSVLVDIPGNRVILRTEVACRNCALEMLCVPEGTKEHETILRIRSKAYVVHAALLALGLDPGKPVRFSPEFAAPSGPVISIYASWLDADGKLQRQDVRRWVRHTIHRYYSAPLASPPPGLQLPWKELRYDQFNNELLWYGPMSDALRDELLSKWDHADFQKAIRQFHQEGQSRGMEADFVFVGSRFYEDPDTGQQFYQAEGGYLICVANFADALLDIREASSADDSARSYEAWTEHVPPEGTTVLLELVPKPEKKASDSPELSEDLPAEKAGTDPLDKELCQEMNSVESTRQDSHQDDPMWEVLTDESGERQTLVGRILVEAQDGGILLEERSGRIRSLKPNVIADRSARHEPFSRLPADELGELLLQQTGPAYRLLATDHFVLCSNAAPAYTDFVSQLLERVNVQFFRFFQDSTEIRLTPPEGKLPVVIHASLKEFQQFARQQHPEIRFDDTPGYYSVRDNLVVLPALSGNPGVSSTAAVRRQLTSTPRQVATVVHEAVHQLAFNCGLQTRMADNPLWLSEGLAIWFEPVSTRSPLLWSRPGQVNPLYQPAFAGFRDSGSVPISLPDLIGSDLHFQQPGSMAAAYTLSWGLTAYLIRHDREGLDRLWKSVSERKPLIQVSTADRINEFRQSIGKSADEIEVQMIPYVARLRVPR